MLQLGLFFLTGSIIDWKQYTYVNSDCEDYKEKIIFSTEHQNKITQRSL